MTIQDLLNSATQRLAHFSDTPRLDAEILLAFVLGKSRTYLFTWPERKIEEPYLQRFETSVSQRLSGTPIAHITGEREFWSLSLRVTADTLIPRPETELLVEKLLEILPQNEILRVADLGTGTGAIALALAHERLSWNITATDQSDAALNVARDNAQILKLSNVKFVLGEWLAPLIHDQFHAIVSNPPYIKENDAHMQQGDVRFEPRSALTSGTDGLNDIRKIAAQAIKHLLPGGVLMIEHGYDQKETVLKIFNEIGYVNIQQYDDLNNNPRLTLGYRPD